MVAIACASLAALVSLAARPLPPVHVDLAVVGGITPVAAAALAEASHAWARYGVSIHRAGGEASPGILVHVRIGGRPSPAAGDAQAIGSIAFHDGMADPEITIYEGRAWELVCVSVGSAAGGWPVSYRDLILGRVLGRALAHELGHFLLQSRTHSKSGLMRASQAMADLMAPDGSRLFLTDEDLAALASALLRVRRAQPPPGGCD